MELLCVVLCFALTEVLYLCKGDLAVLCEFHYFVKEEDTIGGEWGFWFSEQKIKLDSNIRADEREGLLEEPCFLLKHVSSVL